MISVCPEPPHDAYSSRFEHSNMRMLTASSVFPGREESDLQVCKLKFVCSKNTFARLSATHSHQTPAWCCYCRNTSQTSANHGRFSGLSSYNTVALRGLRLAELQKGTLVHVAGTESFDVIGDFCCTGLRWLGNGAHAEDSRPKGQALLIVFLILFFGRALWIQKATTVCEPLQLREIRENSLV